MANGTSAAVTEAARLGEIEFPEFTTKLVTDVFDSLVAANLRQMKSYSELLEATSKTLSAYIKDSQDEIGGEELMQWLAAVTPSLFNNDSSELAKLETKAPNDAQVAEIKAALEIPGDLPATEKANVPAGLTADATLTGATKDALLAAIAKRIAADRYTLLQHMVRMGVLRLVVESGVIETRLTFNTYGSSFREQSTAPYVRAVAKPLASGGLAGFALGSLPNVLRSLIRVPMLSLSVSPTTVSQRDISGSNVQIFGRVQINFKTDYAPLSEL